jgi:acetyltransferase-like isoleucine patch superfamily enzyme
MRHYLFKAFTYLPKIESRLRGGFTRMMMLWAGGTCGSGLRIERGFRLRRGFHSGLRFGKDIYFGKNTTLDVIPGAVFAVGFNATFTESNFISVSSRLDIGEHFLLGEQSSIRDSSHDFSDKTKPITYQPMISKAISIDRDVWIGRGCAILKGVSIGEGAIIAANAVVNRDVAPMTIVGGVPAKFIRNR